MPRGRTRHPRRGIHVIDHHPPFRHAPDPGSRGGGRHGRARRRDAGPGRLRHHPAAERRGPHRDGGLPRHGRHLRRPRRRDDRRRTPLGHGERRHRRDRACPGSTSSTSPGARPPPCTGSATVLDCEKTAVAGLNNLVVTDGSAIDVGLAVFARAAPRRTSPPRPGEQLVTARPTRTSTPPSARSRQRGSASSPPRASGRDELHGRADRRLDVVQAGAGSTANVVFLSDGFSATDPRVRRRPRGAGQPRPRSTRSRSARAPRAPAGPTRSPTWPPPAGPTASRCPTPPTCPTSSPTSRPPRSTTSTSTSTVPR